MLWFAFLFAIPAAIMVTRHESHHTQMRMRFLIIHDGSKDAECRYVIPPPALAAQNIDKQN
jgi:hypothetical protein